jgi:hypothetical protein
MEAIGKALGFAIKMLLFIVLTVIFIPAFLIVNFMQEPWNKMLGELFNL